MIEAIQPSPYGNIYKSGSTSNGRIVYSVVDSSGKIAGKVSLPPQEADTFENAYSTILSSASSIQKYTLENSSKSDKEKRK